MGLETETEATAKVVVSQTVTIPPKSEARILGKLENSDIKGEILISSSKVHSNPIAYGCTTNQLTT